MTTTKNVLKILEAQRLDIQERFRVNVKGLVGSYAHGNPQPSSDIDILVDFMPGATLIDFVGLAQFLEELLHQPIDLVPEKDIRKELRQMMLADAIYL